MSVVIPATFLFTTKWLSKALRKRKKGRDTKVPDVVKSRGQRELFYVNTELVEWTSSENLNLLNIDL